MEKKQAIKMLKAKADCMEKQCKGIYEDCNEDLCDSCDLCYEQGTMGDQIKMLRQVANWLRKGVITGTDAEAIEESYNKGKEETCDSIMSKMLEVWKKYEADPNNVPKPDFVSAFALVRVLKEEKGDSV